MTWSANEILGLATKAARGAGAPPAQAAAFGRVAAQHLSMGRPAYDLETALYALPQGPIMALPVFFMRLAEKAAYTPATATLPSDALVQSYAETQPYACRVLDGEVVLDTTKPPLRRSPKRTYVPEDLAATLSAFAAKTFVPETDASRLAGAGAGLTDND